VGDAACKIGAVSDGHSAHDCHVRYPIRRSFGRTVVPMDRREIGRRGEDLAADHLLRRGFSIVERNFRTRWGELDIVAFDGRTLVFCEVKSRRCATQSQQRELAAVPFESLHPRKRHQVRRMANVWMSNRLERPYAPLVRFDAIGVTFEAHGELVRLDHLEGAF
jgi:putative endonuclease